MEIPSIHFVGNSVLFLNVVFGEEVILTETSSYIQDPVVLYQASERVIPHIGISFVSVLRNGCILLEALRQLRRPNIMKGARDNTGTRRRW